MIPYAVYKVMHLIGAFMVLLSIGGLTMHVINGGTRDNPWRKQVAITHGIGLFLSLLGGFGALARLGLAQNGLPGWVIAKLVVWTIFGGLTAIIMRKPQAGKMIWIFAILLGSIAAWLGTTKPF